MGREGVKESERKDIQERLGTTLTPHCQLDYKYARRVDLFLSIARLTLVEAFVVYLQVLDGQFRAVDENAVNFQFVPAT